MQEKVKLEIDDVCLAYGATQVLRNVALCIEPGEFFALLGPSGSGKSTLLRVIAGFSTAQSGRVRIGGADITDVTPWKRNIGMVFQNYALWPHMTVAQNVAFGLEERKLAKSAIHNKVALALELVGLQDFALRYPGQLSGGQQQRVALARTVAIEPAVLLLDEPLSNLDARLRVHMRTELLQLQRKLGITTIFVTHDQEEALSIADRIAVLDQGIIQQVGAPMQLYDHPVNRFIAEFVGTINLLSGVITGSGSDAVFDSPAIGRIHLPAAVGAPLPTGHVQIALRPHALQLAAAGSCAAGERIWLAGRVEQREFLGEFVRYRVKIGSVELLADQQHLSGVPTFVPGDPVSVGILSDQIRVLAA